MKNAVIEKSIIETINGNGSFSVLMHVLRSTGLIDVLKAPDIAYTLFAPGDAAFQTLSPDGTLQRLLDDKPRLTATMNLHILPCKVVLAHVDGRMVARTRSGQNILIDTAGGSRVGTDETGHDRRGAVNIICADIDCTNGIVHEIGGVMLPR